MTRRSFLPFRRTVSVATLALLAVALLSGCDNPQQKEARYLKNGIAAADKEDYVKARLAFKNAAQIAPIDAEPIYRLALIDEAEGNIRDAYAGYVAAEQQNPHFHPAVLKVAQYVMAGGLLNEARQRIETVLSEAPNDAEAHAVLASLLLREGKFADAENEARKALALDPADVTACAALAGARRAQNDLPGAVAAVGDGIAHNPRNIGLLSLRIALYADTGDIDGVAAAYRDLFKVRPSDVQFRVALARVFLDAGRLDDAEATYRDALAVAPADDRLKRAFLDFLDDKRGFDAAQKEIDAFRRAAPDSPKPTLWLAELYARHNDPGKAAALLEPLIDGSADSVSLNARTLLAQLNIGAGERQAAHALLDAALTQNPDDGAALTTRARLFFIEGDLVRAVADARAALRLAPKDPAALRLLGESLMAQGHADLALDTMKTLVEAVPDDLAASVRLAQMLQLSGDKAQAKVMIADLARRAPDFAPVWESAAAFAIDRKDWLAAQAALDALAKLDGQKQTALYLKAQMLDAAGRGDEAMEAYAALLADDPTSPIAERALAAFAAADTTNARAERVLAALDAAHAQTPFADAIRGRYLMRLGREDEAASALDRAITGHIWSQAAYLDRAKLWLDAGKTDKALATLSDGARAIPNDVRANLTAAEILVAAKRYEEALAAYAAALDRNPGIDAAANNAALMIANHMSDDKNRLDQARRWAERFAGSKNPYLLDTLAWVYHRQGDDARAQTVIARAMAALKEMARPAPPEMHYHYAAILNRLGQKDLAQAEWTLALPDGAFYDGIEDAKKMRATP